MLKLIPLIFWILKQLWKCTHYEATSILLPDPLPGLSRGRAPHWDLFSTNRYSQTSCKVYQDALVNLAGLLQPEKSAKGNMNLKKLLLLFTILSFETGWWETGLVCTSLSLQSICSHWWSWLRIIFSCFPKPKKSYSLWFLSLWWISHGSAAFVRFAPGVHKYIFGKYYFILIILY